MSTRSELARREAGRRRRAPARRPGPRWRPLLRHGLALAAALAFTLPLIWAVSFSLRQPGLPPPRAIEWLPAPIAWGNYGRIFAVAPLASYGANSLLVAAIAVPLTLLVASWAGFAMAQLGQAARRRLTTLAVLLLMIPSSALWLPRFLLYRSLWLIDTYYPLLAPALMGTTPFFVLLYYWTYRRIPRDLFDQARLDGAGALRIWRTIALPLSLPTSVTVAVLAFSLYWSDLVAPLLYLKSEALYTLPVGLQLLQQMDRTNWPFLMAAAVLITAPTVLLFLVVQRFYWPEGRRG